jgi:phosphatidylglycerol:prolipoprotein diacylglycerol transferase
MYPNLYYAFKDLFAAELPFLKAVNSLGFFMMLAFLPAAWLWNKEYRRRQVRGQLKPREITIVVGQPAGIGLLLFHFLLGFILGYKLFGWPVGLAAGTAWAALTWWQAYKNRLPIPEEHKVKEWPSQLVPGHTVVAVVAGVAGAKLFGVLENWTWFIHHPLMIFTFAGGFAWYGGLITAILVLWFSLHAWKEQRIYMCDAVAPSLMLGYALGRIACQVSGDGDWGIVNLRPKPAGWWPDWLWAYDYPHNVSLTGVPMPDCDWQPYCYHLPIPVYPTPLYECILCLLLFAVLMLLRNKFTIAGRLAAVYLILTGLERFFIEKIRVNPTYAIGSLHPTQAELISVLLIAAGCCFYGYAPRLKANQLKPDL